VIWYSKERKTDKLYFITDQTMNGKDVIEYYHTHFHIEFCFRDAKGFTGLTQSQARDMAKLSFNFNASLTSMNLAKAVAKVREIPFSKYSHMTMMHNAFLFKRFIDVSGIIRPNRRINAKLVKNSLNLPRLWRKYYSIFNELLEK